MKRITTLLLTLQLGLLAGLAQDANPLPIELLDYQGTLNSDGVPVNTPQDLILRLYDSAAGGTPIGESITNSPVEVTNGQFTVQLNSWTVGDFSRTNLHVEVAVRPSDSGLPFITLSPRQRLASVPRAAVADSALMIPASALSAANLGTNVVDAAFLAPGTVQADKIAADQIVKSVNGLRDAVSFEAGDGISLSAAANNTITISAFPPAPWDCTNDTCNWHLLGNANTSAGVNFLGTIDNQDLWFKIHSLPAMRIEWPGDGLANPNIIGGDANNKIIWHEGSVIGGGGSAAAPNVISYGAFSVIGGGRGNSVSNHFSFIGGGLQNRIHGMPNSPGPGWYGVIGGGLFNDIRTMTGTIGGGFYNVLDAEATNSVIAGGNGNYVASSYGAIGGGSTNSIQPDSRAATIGGGQGNLIQTAPFTSIGGGSSNLATTAYSAIPGGSQARTISYAQQAYASGQFADKGDAQASLYVSRNITTDDNETELFLDGASATARMIVPLNGTWTFQTLVVARDNFAPNFNSGGWRIEGVVENYGGLIWLMCQTVTPLLCTDQSGWSVTAGVWSLGADDGLSIKVKGSPVGSPPVRWVATTRTSEVVFQ